MSAADEGTSAAENLHLKAPALVVASGRRSTASCRTTSAIWNGRTTSPAGGASYTHRR